MRLRGEQQLLSLRLRTGTVSAVSGTSLSTVLHGSSRYAYSSASGVRPGLRTNGPQPSGSVSPLKCVSASG